MKNFGMVISILMPMLYSLYTVGTTKDIFVDNTLNSDITDGKYSIERRDNSGTDGNAYRTVQGAINAMDPGDDIYIRGGRYTEKNGNDAAIDIDPSKNGTPENWSSLQSMAGEWAILDGGGQGGLPYDVVLGYRSHDKLGNDDLKYWKFERLEITGGGDPEGDSGAGFWGNGGPFIFRYCYIHDNKSGSEDDNPSGICGTVWQNSLIEYCWFKDNGGYAGSNCANISIYSDYNPAAPTVADINHAIHSNEYRYNLVEGSSVGFKHKNIQILCDRSGYDMENKLKGDKIHHNIFIGQDHTAIMVKQDFCQTYNNIVEGMLAQQESGGSVRPIILHMTCYNNTVLDDGKIRFSVPYDPEYQPVNVHPFWWCVNNIVANSANTWEISAISCAARMVSEGGTIDMSDAKIDRNLIYQPEDNTQFRIGRGAGPCSDWLSVQQMNTCYSTSNWLSYMPGLFKDVSGNDQYKTTGNFALDDSFNISNGGINLTHPYIEGLTLPSYVGAVDPNDDIWIDQVLNLRNLPEGYNGNPGNISTPRNIRIEK
jgi:hypothetical protein